MDATAEREPTLFFFSFGKSQIEPSHLGITSKQQPPKKSVWESPDYIISSVFLNSRGTIVSKKDSWFSDGAAAVYNRGDLELTFRLSRAPESDQISKRLCSAVGSLASRDIVVVRPPMLIVFGCKKKYYVDLNRLLRIECCAIVTSTGVG